MKVEFSNFTKIIKEEISVANMHIKVAVAWFTNKDILDSILIKLEEQVQVDLILNNDYVNNSKKGINLKKYIDKGGSLYFYDTTKLMHNKFAIIDNITLLNGSNNWTNFADFKNEENMFICKDSLIVKTYCEQFKYLKSKSKFISSVIQNKRPKTKAEYIILDEEKNFQNSKELNEILDKITSNKITAWYVKPGTKAELWDEVFHSNLFRFGFDEVTKKLSNISYADPLEIKRIYQEVYDIQKGEKSHIIDKFLNKILEGDAFIAVKGVKEIIGIGIVKSEVMRTNKSKYCTQRKVKWIASYANNPIRLDGKLSGNTIAKVKVNEKWYRIKEKAYA